MHVQIIFEPRKALRTLQEAGAVVDTPGGSANSWADASCPLAQAYPLSRPDTPAENFSQPQMGSRGSSHCEHVGLQPILKNTACRGLANYQYHFEVFLRYPALYLATTGI